MDFDTLLEPNYLPNAIQVARDVTFKAVVSNWPPAGQIRPAMSRVMPVLCLR